MATMGVIRPMQVYPRYELTDVRIGVGYPIVKANFWDLDLVEERFRQNLLGKRRLEIG